MADGIEVESIQVSLGAHPVGKTDANSWPVAILVVYRNLE
jgi:hypothetical protein